MPRGYRNMYAEFVSVRRHVLQVSATGEKDLLEKMREHASGGHPSGFQGSDDSHPLLFHEPYPSADVGPSEDGPFMYAGSPFGSDPNWMRELARDLLERANVLDKERPKDRLLKLGILQPARRGKGPRCLNCNAKAVELTLTVAKPSSQLLYERCRECGWRRNHGWYGGGMPHLYTRINRLNQRAKILRQRKAK